jgi:hypothetical protein
MIFLNPQPARPVFHGFPPWGSPQKGIEKVERRVDRQFFETSAAKLPF